VTRPPAIASGNRMINCITPTGRSRPLDVA